MNRQRFLLPALLLLTVARLFMLPLRELSPLEAYAALCSERLDVWHAMMGPVLPALMRLTTTLFGMNEFGVRAPAPLLMLGTSVMLWRLARGLFNETTASWSVMMFNALPAVQLASVTFTVTTLSITGSVALLSALRLALHRQHAWHGMWWLVSVVLWAMFFTDWPLIMFAVAAAGTLTVTARGRRAALKWPVLPILAGSLGLAVTFFIAWASEHSWIVFQSFPDEPKMTLTQALWQRVLVHPPLASAALLWALARSVMKRPLTYPVAYLYAFAWPMVTLDLLTLRSTPWPQCGFSGWIVPAVILLAHQLGQWEPQRIRLKSRLRTAVVLVTLVQTSVVGQTDVARMMGIP